MNATQSQLRKLVGVAALLGLHASGSSLLADSTADELSALKKQIEALSEKVRVLEQQHEQDRKAAAASSQQLPAISIDTNGVALGAADPRVEQLDQKVRVLERQRELDQEAAAEKSKQAPRVSIGSSGLSVSSADTNFMVALHGVLQVDSRSFFNDGGMTGNDGFLLRRARPILQGTVYRDFDFLFVPDFGTANNGGNNGSQPTPQIYDAFLNYRYSPELQFRVGKFKSPIGLEQLQADVDLAFNERTLATDLVPNRDLGFEFHGDALDGGLSYAVGFLSGVGDARNSSLSAVGDEKAVESRIFVQPLKQTDLTALQGLGLGVAGSYGTSSTAIGLPGTTGGTLPGYATDGQEQFFAYNPVAGTVVADGTHWRLSPQAYYYYGPFGLMGEYVISDQRVQRTGVAPAAAADLQNNAWEVTGLWVLTGEPASYKGVNPAHPFSLSQGHWGALQLAARFAQLNIDSAAFPTFSNPATSARSAQAWSVGLSWWLNKNVRVMADYSHTTFSGGGGIGTTAPATVTRQPENVFFTRFQLAF